MYICICIYMYVNIHTCIHTYAMSMLSTMHVRIPIFKADSALDSCNLHDGHCSTPQRLPCAHRLGLAAGAT